MFAMAQNLLTVSGHERVFVIYKHINLKNGKAYVGWTSGRDATSAMMARWNNHCRDADRGSMCIFHNAIRKHGTECWDHQILETHDVETDTKAGEVRLIAEHKTYRFEHPDMGYNMTRGGEGALGCFPSAQTRARMSASHTGARNPNFGKYGTHHPVSKKLSKPIQQISVETGEVLREFTSSRQAMRETGVHYSNISTCAHGGRPNAGGYRWCLVLHVNGE